MPPLLRLEISRPTVGLWRERLLDLGLPGLEGLPRPARPTSLPSDKVRQIISQIEQPPPGRKRWSCRSMAKAAGISVASVHRNWKDNDLKPHLTRSFKLSTDPSFDRIRLGNRVLAARTAGRSLRDVSLQQSKYFGRLARRSASTPILG